MAGRFHIPVLWLITLTLASSIVSPPAVWASRTNPALAVQTTDGSWHGRGPAENGWGPSGIYDPVRQRMVFFGGAPDFVMAALSSNLVWELSLGGTPSWKALTTSETSEPYGRHSHSAIYDRVRDRMIIFGGQGGAFYGDVWAFSLASHTWTEITPAFGPAPVPRQAHSAIYDPVRDRMIVFGGNNASNIDQNDVWALSLGGTPAWTQVTPSGTPPSARGWHSAIYDPVRDRMVVHAGWLWAPDHSIGDTWSLALSGVPAWTPLAATGSPSPRNSHSAIYDPVGDRMTVYGGWLPDLTVLSFSGSPAWSTVTPAGGGPSLRDGTAGIYDAPRQRMVIYGGVVESHGSVWAVTLGVSPAWSAIAPVGVPTTPSGMVFRDAPRDRMVVLAFHQGQYVRLWARSLSGQPGWSLLVLNGEPPPYSSKASAIYDPPRDRIVLYGGTEETWALGLGTLTWSKIEPPGTLPTARRAHSAIYDPLRDRMIIYGGLLGNDFYPEIWALPLAGGSWYQIVPVGAQPIGRVGHTAIYDPVGDRMVICGGQGADLALRRDVWAFNFATQTWTDITPAVGLPHDAIWMSSVYDPSRHRMLMFGGRGMIGGAHNELWSLSLAATPMWTMLDPSGVKPKERQEHGAIWDPLRDRMVVYGGVGGATNLTDVWEYVPGATTEVPDSPLVAVNGLAFAPPRPNPARGPSVHAFALALPGRVTLEVFDANGRRVRRLLDAQFPVGSHTATWSGEDDRGRTVGSGLYFMKLKCGEQERTTRAVRVR